MHILWGQRSLLFCSSHFTFCLAQGLAHRRHALACAGLMSQHIKPLGSGKRPFRSYMSLSVHFKNPMRYLFVSNLTKKEWSMLIQYVLPSQLFSLRVKGNCVCGRRGGSKREIHWLISFGNEFTPTLVLLPNVLWSQQDLALEKLTWKSQNLFPTPAPSAIGHEVLDEVKD